jgi:hypothetical protein
MPTEPTLESLTQDLNDLTRIPDAVDKQAKIDEKIEEIAVQSLQMDRNMRLITNRGIIYEIGSRVPDISPELMAYPAFVDQISSGSRNGVEGFLVYGKIEDDAKDERGAVDKSGNFTEPHPDAGNFVRIFVPYDRVDDELSILTDEARQRDQDALVASKVAEIREQFFPEDGDEDDGDEDDGDEEDAEDAEVRKARVTSGVIESLTKKGIAPEDDLVASLVSAVLGDEDGDEDEDEDEDDEG